MNFKRALTIIAVLSALLLLDYYYYSNWWIARENISASPKPPEAALQQFQTQIDDVKLHGASLPACPLLFPLLDSKGHVTPLGSYLSYFGMKQASYLPQAILSLPNLSQSFRDFKLFDAESSVDPFYKDQLPYQFQTKDFAEGTWKKTYQGWKIHLRVWGTKPEKTYNQTFAKGNLHNAPGWIAGSLQDYIGFKPSADQAVFLAQPIFTDDADFLRAASLETLFNHGGARLITHWQDLLAKNPDQPEVVGRWMDILDSRENQFHPELMESLLKKQPSCGLASQALAEEYFEAGRYNDALPLLLGLLKNDDNNASLYAWTASCLEGANDWDGAVQLTRNWTEKYPGNPESWMALAVHLRDKVRHTPKKDLSPPDSSTSTSVSTLSTAVTEGIAAAQKASQLSPGDARVWTLLIDYGTDAKFSRADLDSYLQKAIQLDPTDNKPFDAYLNDLNDEGPVGAQDAWNFAKQNAPQHPLLFYFQASLDLSANDLAQTLINLKNFRQEPELEQAYQADLKKDPGNLSLWRQYLRWTDLAGTTPKALAFAQTLAAGHLELKTLPPTLVLLSWEAATANQNPEAGKAKAVSQIAQADQALLVLDEGNWRVWNEYAKLCVENHLDAEAKKAMDAIGDNCDTGVWPQQNFDKARVALGLDPIPPQPGTPAQQAEGTAVQQTEVSPAFTPTQEKKPSPEPTLSPTPLVTPSVSPAKPASVVTQAPTAIPVAILKVQTPLPIAALARVAAPSPQPTVKSVVSPSQIASTTPSAPLVTPTP